MESIVCKCFQFGQGLILVVWEKVNSLPNDNLLDWLKLKAFADCKIDVT